MVKVARMKGREQMLLYIFLINNHRKDTEEMKQEELRNKLKQMMEIYGTTITFIANAVGYDKAYVSRFIHDKNKENSNTTNLERALEQFYYERIRLWNEIQP